jgi:hypothetical protein
MLGSVRGVRCRRPRVQTEDDLTGTPSRQGAALPATARQTWGGPCGTWSRGNDRLPFGGRWVAQSGLARVKDRRHIAGMVEPDDPKQRYDFARLLTQIEALRSRAVQEFAKRLPPDQHQRIVDSLRDVLNKLTNRKK